jgi:hypothetical protein
MKCDEVKTLLVDLVLNEVKLQDKLKTWGHFVHCKKCRQEFSEYKKVVKLLKTYETEVPETLSFLRNPNQKRQNLIFPWKLIPLGALPLALLVLFYFLLTSKDKEIIFPYFTPSQQEMFLQLDENTWSDFVQNMVPSLKQLNPEEILTLWPYVSYFAYTTNQEEV